MNEQAVSRHTPEERSIITVFRRPIWCNFVAAVRNYELLSAGDRVAVCISGGKDSLMLSACLLALSRHSDIPFSLQFLSMDPGYTEENRQQVRENAERLGITLHLFETDILSAAENSNSPCHICAAMRRGYLYKEAGKLGCNKIALGHHLDDVVETVMLSLLYGGQFKTMMPKVKSDNWPGMELIRPLYLVREQDIIAWRDFNGFRCLRCACRTTAEGNGKRLEIKRLLSAMEKENPKVKNNILSSVSSVDLDTVLGYRPRGATEIIPFTEGY